MLRLHRGEPLAADELRIELTPAGGDWVLVSDAWSFAEGEGAALGAGEVRRVPVDDTAAHCSSGFAAPELETL